MTRDEWVQAALAACVAQGLPEHVEDPATLDLIAALLMSTSNDRGHDDARPA